MVISRKTHDHPPLGGRDVFGDPSPSDWCNNDTSAEDRVPAPVTAAKVSGRRSEPSVGERRECADPGQLRVAIANPRRKRKKRIMLAANPERADDDPVVVARPHRPQSGRDRHGDIDTV